MICPLHLWNMKQVMCTSPHRAATHHGTASNAERASHTLRSAHIFTGDDTGHIAVWDLIPVLVTLNKHCATEPLAHAVQCINPKRIVQYDAAADIATRNRRGVQLREEPSGMVTERPLGLVFNVCAVIGFA